MALVSGHGKQKYVTGECLQTSRGRAWQERHHSEGDLGEVMPRDTEVIVMLEGNLRVRRRGDGRLQEHDAAPGTVWLCPAGVAEDMIHLFGEIRDSIHLYLPALPLSAACLLEFGLDPAGVRLHYKGGFRDPTIETIARTISAELHEPGPMSRLVVETMSAALGAYLVRHHSNQAGKPLRLPATRGSLERARLARVLTLIEARLGEELTLADLAEEASLSPFHFARCFKAATGKTPHRYILDQRVARATRLLQAGSLPLAEIAAACGFCSQAHFSHVFRQAVGLAPGAFRTSSR